MEPKKQTAQEAFSEAMKPLAELKDAVNTMTEMLDAMKPLQEWLDAVYTLRQAGPETLSALVKEIKAEKELKPGETAAETQFPELAEQKKRLAKLLNTPASELKALHQKVVDAEQKLRGPKNN